VAFAHQVCAATRKKLTNLSGKTTLRDLIGIFSRARLTMGPDSGPMHLAAATGVPVISLWGATSPIRSAPWGSEAFVLQGPAACSPCYTRHCPIGRACMQRITPDHVMQKAREILHPFANT
jgi:ADP-heptose:LPS heptosyltransferase